MHALNLPPMTGLLAFDALVRYGSVQKAAEALHLSQPATSRRLIALETYLGVTLFDRGTRPMVLSRAGEELHETLANSLSNIDEAVRRLRTPARQTVTISAGAGFSTYWLIPRLARMQRAFPSMSLRIVSQSHERESDATGDLQVRFGSPPWPGARATALFSERVFPVASPLLLRGRNALRTLEQLKSLPLLDMEVRRQPWFDWPGWWAQLGQSIVTGADITHFDSYPLVVSAALAGQGVCLCWDGLLDAFLQSGALERVTAYETTSERGYFITHRPEPDADHPANRIREWIVAEARTLPAGSFQQNEPTVEPTATVLHTKTPHKGNPRQKRARLVR